MSILAFTIIAIIVNFVIGIIKDGHVAIGAAIIADLILVAVYAL